MRCSKENIDSTGGDINSNGLIGWATLSCLAICLSAPLNGLSPSLSMVAHDFGLDTRERDIYLGSYIALSTMFGQMIGSCISGVLADAYSRTRILII
eukprot:gene3339-4553_t